MHGLYLLWWVQENAGLACRVKRDARVSSMGCVLGADLGGRLQAAELPLSSRAARSPSTRSLRDPRHGSSKTTYLRPIGIHEIIAIP